LKNGDNNCQLRQERTNIRRNLKRQLQANLMEFNYFLMNGQPKQQDGRIERKTHDQVWPKRDKIKMFHN
jgi:hypothetical protein